MTYLRVNFSGGEKKICRIMGAKDLGLIEFVKI